MSNEKDLCTRLGFARQLIQMGISVIPLHHRSKEPSIASWRRYQSILSTEQEITQWLGSDWCNYGVVAGWENLVIIDFDDIEIYNLWALWIRTRSVDAQYVFDTAFKVRTRRGMHVYVTTWEAAQNSKRRHIDIQAQGKYVVGPLSVHPSGHVYEPLGALVFPIVFDLNEILPLDLFPQVSGNSGSYQGDAPAVAKIATQYDPFAAASMSNDVDLITKVKASVRIESLFPDVRKTSADGRWYAARCPFHDDHHPSFWIDVRAQLCGCNVCGMKPMDVINLWARMKNISESVAVSALANEIGIWR